MNRWEVETKAAEEAIGEVQCVGRVWEATDSFAGREFRGRVWDGIVEAKLLDASAAEFVRTSIYAADVLIRRAVRGMVADGRLQGTVEQRRSDTYSGTVEVVDRGQKVLMTFAIALRDDDFAPPISQPAAATEKRVTKTDQLLFF